MALTCQIGEGESLGVDFTTEDLSSLFNDFFEWQRILGLSRVREGHIRNDALSGVKGIDVKGGLEVRQGRFQEAEFVGMGAMGDMNDI